MLNMACLRLCFYDLLDVVVAAVGGDEKCARLLMRHGAKLNRRDKDGKTALMIAVVNGHQKMVEHLLEKDADVSMQNEVGTGVIIRFHCFNININIRFSLDILTFIL